MGRRDRIRRDSNDSDSSFPVKLVLLILALVLGIPAIAVVVVLVLIFAFGFWVAGEARKAGDQFAEEVERAQIENANRQRQMQLEIAARQKEEQENAKKKKEPPNLPPLAKIFGTDMCDLVGLIDPKKDAAADPEKWQILKKGVTKELHCRDGNFRPRIEIPYIPPAEYDFIVKFSQPNLRNGISLIMPNPTGGGFFWKIGEGSGAGPGSGYGFGSNPLNIDKAEGGLIKPIFTYTTKVEVRKNSVRAFLDDRELMFLPTNFKNLVLKDFRDLRDARLLAVDCDDPTTFHQIRVVEVTGVGKRMR